MQNNDTRKAKFRDVLDKLEKRGGMSTIDYNYAAVVNYLFGFSIAESEYNKEPLLVNFQEFVNLKVGDEKCRIHWAWSIRQLLAHNNEAEALCILFNLLREYIDEE